MKKLLALVLALVMSMSLVTISNAAFKDADKISNKEAVDVMAAVGVLAGYDNGEFGATDTLTRAQACKIIAYLDLGKDVAEALPAVQVFSDLPAGNWAAKYVAYCADAGYVSGVGDNKFAPDEKVTGYQFGKMLLCALGYDQKIEEMTGASWEIKVAKLMEKNSLTKGTDKLGSAALTREEAAQYGLNALKATCVEYDEKGSTITAGDVTIITGAKKAQNVTYKGADYTKYVAISGETGADNNTELTVELGEKLYKGKLEKTISADDMKRPATKWTYKNEDVGKYGNTADETFVITKTTGAKASLAAWLKGINDDYYITAAGDLADSAISNTVLFVNSSATAATSYASGSNWGVGDVVEVYENSTDSNKIDKIVVTQYTLYKIDKVDTQVNSTDAKNDVKAYISLKNLSGTTTVVKDTEFAGYAAATYVKDAYVAAVVSGTKVLSSYVVTPAAEGSVSSYTGSKYTVNGSTYEKATKANVSQYVANDFEGTYAAYTDANGYLLGIVVVKASQVVTDASYVVSTWAKTGTDNYNKTTTKYYAQLVDMDGVLSEVVTGYTTSTGKIYGMDNNGYTYTRDDAAGTYWVLADGTIATSGTAMVTTNTPKYTQSASNVDVTAGHVFTTEESSDDYTKLVAFADTSSVKVGSVGSVTSKAKDTNKYSSVSINGGTNNVYVVSGTKYIIVEGTQGEAKVTVKTGADASYTVASTTATVIANKSGNNYEAAYVIIPTGSYSGSTSADVIYVNSTTAYTVDGGKIIKAFDMDGNEIDVKIASSASVSANTFYTIDSTNTKGVSTLSAATALTGTGDWADTKTGSIANAKFVNLYGDKFSMTYSSNNLNDIDADKVVIIDKHEKDNDEFQAGTSYDGTDNYTNADNYQDTYSGNVTTLADMNSLTSDGYTVTFSVSIDEDGAQLIVIKEVSKTITTTP